jgi:Zn-dependent alcohol dehydrogenase
MDEQAVREHAQATADALLAGDIGKASEQMSKELHSTLGQFAAMLPMPMTEASIESIESTPTGYRVVLHLVGEGDTLRLETRWKDRDGQPTIVEASRVHEEPVVSDVDAEATEDEDR